MWHEIDSALLSRRVLDLVLDFRYVPVKEWLVCIEIAVPFRMMRAGLGAASGASAASDP